MTASPSPEHVAWLETRGFKADAEGLNWVAGNLRFHYGEEQWFLFEVPGMGPHPIRRGGPFGAHPRSVFNARYDLGRDAISPGFTHILQEPAPTEHLAWLEARGFTPRDHAPAIPVWGRDRVVLAYIPEKSGSMIWAALDEVSAGQVPPSSGAKTPEEMIRRLRQHAGEEIPLLLEDARVRTQQIENQTARFITGLRDRITTANEILGES